MKKILILLFYLISLVSINIYFYSIYLNGSQLSSKAYLNVKCNPINKSYKQFRVTLDGHTYPKHLNLHTNKSIDFECLNSSKKLKLILLWNKFWNIPDYRYGLGIVTPFLKNNCPVTQCELTTDKSRLHNSDFVIVHMIDKIDYLPQQEVRPAKQRWIFFIYESPFISNKNYSVYNNFFNLTATYRSDSDFPSPYTSQATMNWQMNENFKPHIDYHKRKKKFAFALISNCQNNSRRLDYIRELRTHRIQIDVYGRCGNKKCPNFKDKSECKKYLANEYMFYLAFENSLCDDYITEKFFSTLKLNIIPVVLGSGKYEEHVR